MSAPPTKSTMPSKNKPDTEAEATGSLDFVTITAPIALEEPICGRLFLLGYRGLELLNPDPGTVQVTIYAPHRSAEELRDALEPIRQWVDGYEVDVREGSIPDVQWYERWKKHYVPRAIGERFEVRPPWSEAPVPAGRWPLLIEPKNAFGTGYHETTRLMVAALEETPLEGLRYLDAGCGSAILSVAALRLGAKEILGFDIDAESIENAEENLRINDVDGETSRVSLRCSIPSEIEGSYDVVGANIIANVLHEVRDDLYHLTRPGGTLLLCGLLEGDQDEIRVHYEATGLKTLEQLHENGWYLLRMIRP
jgi:ribosomal protein L11 methyltransferase